jgi:transcriptional regulator with XRE-family HTH domain
MTTLAERLQQARGRAKLTQESLANRIGTSKANGSKIEMGLNTSPSAELMVKAADICQVDIRWLVLGTSTAPEERAIRIDANQALAKIPEEMRELLISMIEKFAEAAEQRFWMWAK